MEAGYTIEWTMTADRRVAYTRIAARSFRRFPLICAPAFAALGALFAALGAVGWVVWLLLGGAAYLLALGLALPHLGSAAARRRRDREMRLTLGREAMQMGETTIPYDVVHDFFVTGGWFELSEKAGLLRVLEILLLEDSARPIAEVYFPGDAVRAGELDGLVHFLEQKTGKRARRRR